MTQEIFKPIPGYPGYEVSNLGQIKSFRRLSPYILKQHLNAKGYPAVFVGKSKHRPVHKLVTLAFIGPCPEGMEVCHNDGNPLNNHLDNLRYGTRQENGMDRAMHNSAKRQALLERLILDITEPN